MMEIWYIILVKEGKTLNWRKRQSKFKYDESDTIIKKLSAIYGIEDIENFLNPTQVNVNNPYLLKNIKQVAERIILAINLNEKIAIHSDVDADGVCSTAILYNYLKKFTNKITYFHAQRSDGHGIHYVKDQIPENTKLLIILDSSSNQNKVCEEIRRRGIDIIIIDHHLIDEKNENCILVNPQQEDCFYPNKDASGSLLTYKICQVIDEYLDVNYSGDLVDLAGLGLHSDQMDMMNLENRYFVKESLENIKNCGLKAILSVLNLDRDLSASDYAFSVTPLINGATRLDKIELVLKLLTTDDQFEAVTLAQEIKKLNDNRKQQQEKILDRIRPAINPNDKCIIIVDESFGKGMNGLIAGQLANEYQRPAIVLRTEAEYPNELRGSFRSYGFFNFLDFVSKMPHVTFSGGHKQAGGLGVSREFFEEFKNAINEGLKNESFEKVIYYDLEIDIENINENIVAEIEKFKKITGKGFYEPKFLIKNAYVIKKQSLGNDNTLKASALPESETWFVDEENDLVSKIDLMKFRTDLNFINNFPKRQTVDVVGSLSINKWTNPRTKKEVRKIQVIIEDYRVV
jgi:Single-stranded DNA-specific exonuclease